MSETVIRAFELPLRGCLAETWPLLRECWKHATELANWCVFTLASKDKPDLPRHPGIKGRKLKGLYGLASETFKFKTGFWSGAAISASTICRDVERHYHRERNAVVRFHRQALRTYRYPYPFPVHAQSWKDAGFDEAGKPWIDVALPGGRVRLNLRGGPEFGRQLGHFRDVVNGKLPKLALSIREQPASPGCHRPTGEHREAGGGSRQHSRVMVKMVAHLPVREKPGERVLTVCTDPNAFLVAEIDGRQAWVLNADHVRRLHAWLAVHEDRLARFAQDTKAERRLDSDRRRQLNESRERACEKHTRRMSSWLHETAAHLVGFAARQRVGCIEFFDKDQGFIERFPWYRLNQLLQDKCTQAGVRLVCLSDGESDCVATTTGD